MIKCLLKSLKQSVQNPAEKEKKEKKKKKKGNRKALCTKAQTQKKIFARGRPSNIIDVQIIFLFGSINHNLTIFTGKNFNSVQEFVK